MEYKSLFFLIKKVLGIIPLIFVVIIVNFVIIHLAPGDPVYYLAGEAGTPEFFEMTRIKLGLDKPLHEQLIKYILMVLKGDLGYSYIYGQPVSSLILSRIKATLLLMTPAFILSIIIGILIGAFSAKKRYSKLDIVITFLSLLGYSMPIFWLGMILLLVFAVNWRIFPVQGMFTIGSGFTSLRYFLDILHHMFLPCFVLAVYNVAVTTRLTRGSIIEVLTQDYIVTARSNGLSENVIVLKHALRNALLPVVTYTGMRFGTLLTGAVLTETIFAWPGLGRLLYDALSLRDYPVMMGMFIMVSILVALSNLITDIVYTFIDPRIRYDKFESS
ncbi:ABC transporter permease [Thermoproteota archaeon]